MANILPVFRIFRKKRKWLIIDWLSTIYESGNGTRTRDLNLGKVALSSPQNATRLGVTNWAISFYDDFLECVLPCFSHWLNEWLNICVCLLVCKWLLIKELFNGLNKFCNTFFLVIHWHSEFIVFMQKFPTVKPRICVCLLKAKENAAFFRPSFPIL